MSLLYYKISGRYVEESTHSSKFKCHPTIQKTLLSMPPTHHLIPMVIYGNGNHHNFHCVWELALLFSCVVDTAVCYENNIFSFEQSPDPIPLEFQGELPGKDLNVNHKDCLSLKTTLGGGECGMWFSDKVLDSHV